MCVALTQLLLIRYLISRSENVVGYRETLESAFIVKMTVVVKILKYFLDFKTQLFFNTNDVSLGIHNTLYTVINEHEKRSSLVEQ